MNLLRTKFKEFPNELFELHSLEKIYINIKAPAFYVIPDNFNLLPNLTDFSIIGKATNRDTLFPESFYQLSNLKKLEINSLFLNFLLSLSNVRFTVILVL